MERFAPAGEVLSRAAVIRTSTPLPSTKTTALLVLDLVRLALLSLITACSALDNIWIFSIVRLLANSGPRPTFTFNRP